MSHAFDPHPALADARAAHPSMSSLSDADAASALAGIRTTAGRAGTDRRPLRSVSVPGPRFAAPARRSWRTRRRKAWLGAGDHGSATLLGAHRSAPGDWSTAPPAA
jgi:hypothetical protein